VETLSGDEKRKKQIISMAETILVISPVPLFPSHAGNRTRILSICTELKKKGYKLDFFYTGFHRNLDPSHNEFYNGKVLEHDIGSEKTSLFKEPALRMKELVNGLMIKVHRTIRNRRYGYDSARYNKSLYDFKNIRKLHLLQTQVKPDQYKAVLLNYAVYSFYLDLFDKRTVKIIDTHDRLADRYKLYMEEGEEPVAWKSISPMDEQKAIQNADVIWAITNSEAEYFSRLTDGKKPEILTVPHLALYREMPLKNKRTSKTILTVGGKGKINVTALNWFFKTVWKQITDEIPGLKLLVAGSICDIKDELEPAENVTFYGRYNEPEEVYQLSEFCINPIRFGTGLKIKTLEGLSFGKTVLTTSTGADGLERFRGKGLIVKNSPEEWIRILRNRFGSVQTMQPSANEELRIEIGKMYKETQQKIFRSVEQKA
jgi:polysaccharide biosynthesis protein PslH